MGYKPGNQIFGCPKASALDPRLCVLPELDSLDSLPGVLLREDKRVLDANALVFPDFDYQAALDHPQPFYSVNRLPATGDLEITTTGGLYVTAGKHIYSAEPAVLIGGFSESFIELQDGDNGRHWISPEGGYGTWVPYHIYLPEAFELQRVRVYGGYGANFDEPLGHDLPLGLELFVAGNPTPISTVYNLDRPNIDLNVNNRIGAHFILQAQRGETGLVRLRGLRFFGKLVGSDQTIELYPPAEPVATTSFGSTFDGSVDNIVGSDQLVAVPSIPFQPQASWHSSAQTPGAWVSVDVAFSEEKTLVSILVATGHSGGIHQAEQIQIERECVCRSEYFGEGGVCGSQSISQCEAAGGAGRRIYEVVHWEPNAGQSEIVVFPASRAKRWRIALKTLDDPADSESWMVVRGLRFFADGEETAGIELFPTKGLIE